MNLHGKMTRRSIATMLCLGLMFGVSGCHKRVQAPQLPQILTPVALETAPESDHPPMVDVPEDPMPPIPIAAAAAKPRRRRPVVAKAPPVPDPVQMASTEPAPEAEAAAIGSLTAGGEANPRTQQEASDLIASIEKRLNSLPAQMTEEEKTQISKVRNFQRQAQEALSSGDAEGAKTLATKAKLLLDDLVK